ncbi:MAG: thioredoxin, partial [Bacteroides sp.]|nr:thioredoxin [Bacteroides sp.]
MKMLSTSLHEFETAAELDKYINENENVMVCCGRMGPMCIPVYGVMEELEEERSNIKFATMAFDSPEAGVI